MKPNRCYSDRRHLLRCVYECEYIIKSCSHYNDLLISAADYPCDYLSEARIHAGVAWAVVMVTTSFLSWMGAVNQRIIKKLLLFEQGGEKGGQRRPLRAIAF